MTIEQLYKDKHIQNIMRKRERDLEYIKKHGALKNNRRRIDDERPLDYALDKKLESYEKYLINLYAMEIWHHLVGTKARIKEENVFDYVEKYLENKHMPLKYTIGLVDLISLALIEQAGEKYIK